jgi:phage shock protein A
MFKLIVTLVRGKGHEAAESIAERNMLSILDQQLRDCSAAVAKARKALAIAMAQADRERVHHKRTADRIADLEERAADALDKGADAPAREAAEAIAILEAEVQASVAAQARFDQEIARLKDVVRDAEARLSELKRRRQIAAATEQAQRLRGSPLTAGPAAANTLRDAESTLTRLRRRQEEIDQASDALGEMDVSGDPAKLVERLADAGFGPPVRASADDVLARIRARGAKASVPAAAKKGRQKP